MSPANIAPNGEFYAGEEPRRKSYAGAATMEPGNQQEECRNFEHEAACGNNRRQQKSLLNERKLTIAEAARALSVGATSLRRIIANGEMPVVRMTNKTLILESDLEAYLAASRDRLPVSKPIGRRLPQLPREVATSKHLN